MVKNIGSQFLELDYSQFQKNQNRPTKQSPLKIIDLPGFLTIEDRLLLGSAPNGEISTDLRLAIDELSKDTFEITEDDTLFMFPENFEKLSYSHKDDWEMKHDAHEVQFQTPYVNNETAVQILLSLGFDFRDPYDQPLLCLRHFKRQVEAAARGICGKIPKHETADLNRFSTNLLREKEEFERRKRKNKR